VRQSIPDDALVVVESFLAARDARDLVGATGWCAALLELQDIEGQWFVNEPTNRYWLRQLTDKYVLDTLQPPVANGNTVTWTERLTPRTEEPWNPWSTIMTIEVSAVIRDGRISYLSAPYPPLPRWFHSPRRPPAPLAGGGGRATLARHDPHGEPAQR
jgi:hypothetical protein